MGKNLDLDFLKVQGHLSLYNENLKVIWYEVTPC